MAQRVKNHFKLAPEATKAMMALEASFKSSGLEPKLQELVRMRASQVNGCAFCIAQHATDALKLGEDAMRLHLLNGWRESTLYSERERAALAWTEALTRVSETHAPDEVYAQVKAQFSDAEQVALTYLIGSINVWNRLQIGFRVPPAGEAAAKAA